MSRPLKKRRRTASIPVFLLPGNGVIVSSGEERHTATKRNVWQIALLSIGLMLPGTAWMLLGWSCFFFPLIVFVYITKYGWQYTNNHLLPAVIAALVGGYFFQSLELIVFMVMLLPAGYMVALSTQRNERPWQAGLRSLLSLGGLLFIFFGVLSLHSEQSFFQAIITSLNAGIDDALRIYSDNNDLSAENYIVFERTLLQVKATAPSILPAIMANILVFVSWTTVVLGNTLLPRTGCTKPWPEYRFWKLPEVLIWAFICSAIGALMPYQPIQTTGLNILIVVCLLYSFQGLAIAVFFLKKWNVPKLMRTAIYIMIIFQSFGTVILIVAGVADVWFDLRHIEKTPINGNTDAE